MGSPAGNNAQDNPWGSGWRLAVGLFLMVVALGAVVWVLVLSVRTLRSLEPEVAAAIVSGLVALGVALATTWLGRRLERRAAEQTAQQEKRIPVYEDFVRDLLQQMGLTKHKDDRSELDSREVVRVLASFTEKAIVWGSGDVLKAWVDFRYLGMQAEQAADGQAHGYRLLASLEDLFLTMRADLGLDNQGLQRGDLLKLFINDLDPSVLARGAPTD